MTSFDAIFLAHGLCPMFEYDRDIAIDIYLKGNDMASLGMNFDASSVAPSQPFELLPPGKYVAQIVASEMQETKSGNGSFLKLEMEIVEGELTGRKIWDRLNLNNPNQQAVEIAQRALSAICHAIGVMNVSDSEELHYRPMVIDVRVERRKVNGVVDPDSEPQNVIKGYAPVGPRQAAHSPAQAARPAAVAQSHPVAAVQRAAAKPAAAGGMPWRTARA